MRAFIATVVGTLGIAALVACSAQSPFDPCPQGVTRVEIFNAYGDHQIADRQVLEGGEAEGVCESILPYTAATAHEFGPGELGLRRITVLRFEGETTRTVWVYGLPGPDTGTALVLDDGSSFLLPNRGPEPYWSAVAEAVGREELPRR